MPTPVALPYIDPFVYTIGSVFDASQYGSITISVTGLVTDTLLVEESIDSVPTWSSANMTINRQTSNQSATISANGTYLALGNVKLRISKTGSSSTPVITIAGSN